MMAKDISDKGAHNILLVDDRPENIFSLEHMLSEDGRTFLKAYSGSDALRIAYKEDISLILLDVQMPEMNGFETAELLKTNNKTKNIPIIFVTAINKESKYVVKGLDEGAVDYLFKPLDTEITRAKVSTLLKFNLQKKKLEEYAAELQNKNQIITREIERSEQLLLNILPYEVAQELKENRRIAAKMFDSVSVMFCDFKDFTKIVESLSAAELVAEIDHCFKAFDQIMEKHNVEKIKTIGDCYMAAGGLPVVNETHAMDVVNAAFELLQFMELHEKENEASGKVGLGQIRIGIHTGPVVAGVVGLHKFVYDIWGDTVNIASRMESSGQPGKVNITGSTYEIIKSKTDCLYRGKIEAKNKGRIDMYFVERSNFVAVGGNQGRMNNESDSLHGKSKK